MPVRHHSLEGRRAARSSLISRSRAAFLVACVAPAALSAVVPTAAKPTYAVFDPPGSIYTTAHSISNGVAAGFYQDNQGRYHGFMRDTDGTMTIIDAAETGNTYGASVDRDGRVTGFYGSNGVDHGFIRAADGSLVSFDVKGSASTIPLEHQSRRDPASFA